MKWGLLAGAGRGLSQGASMLNQGMAEDRAVKRAEEIERMREASIERRWKMDVARQDQIRKEDRVERKAEIADTRDYEKGVRGEQQRLVQVEGELKRIDDRHQQGIQQIAQMFDEPIKGMQQELNTLLRIRQSNDPAAMLGQLAEATGVTSPAEIEHRVGYLRLSLEDLNKQRTDELSRFREDLKPQIAAVAKFYGNDVDRTSFAGLVSQIMAMEKKDVDDVLKLSQGMTDEIAADLMKSGRQEDQQPVPDLTKPPAVDDATQSTGLLTPQTTTMVDRLDGRLSREDTKLARMQSADDKSGNNNPSTMRRIQDLQQETERLRALREQWANPQSGLLNAQPSQQPGSKDWRKDPEYLNRINHFR